MRFNGEFSDLEKAREIGKKWGFGNVIQYLQQAWDKSQQESALKIKGESKKYYTLWEKHFDRKKSVLLEDMEETK